MLRYNVKDEVRHITIMAEEIYARNLLAYNTKNEEQYIGCLIWNGDDGAIIITNSLLKVMNTKNLSLNLYDFNMIVDYIINQYDNKITNKELLTQMVIEAHMARFV